MTLPIDLIEPGMRLREVYQPKVLELIASIREVGLLNPVTVYPRRKKQAGLVGFVHPTNVATADRSARGAG